MAPPPADWDSAPSYDDLARAGGTKKPAAGAPGAAPAAGPSGSSEGVMPDDAHDAALMAAFERSMNEAAGDPAMAATVNPQDAELEEMLQERGLAGDHELVVPEALQKKTKTTPKRTPEHAQESEPDDIDALFAEEERGGGVAEQRATALQALKRDGYTKEALRRLDDETLLEVGLARAEAQRKLDAKFNQLRGKGKAQAEPELDEGEGETEGEEGDDPGHAVAPGQAVARTLSAAADAASKKVAGVFSEHFGEEIGTPITKALREAFVEFAKPLQAENERLKSGMQFVAGHMEQQVVRDARRELVADFPQLKEPAVWKNVVKTYFRLSKSGTYSGMEGVREALDHAVRIEVGGAAVARRGGEFQTQKASGRPTTSRRSAAPTNGKKRGGDEGLASEFDAFMEAHERSAKSGWSL